MPRRSARVPAYRKHKASGQAVVEIQGRTHYLGPYNSARSKILYDQLIAEYLVSNRSPHFGVAPEERSLTVNELLDAYSDYCDSYYRDAEGKSTGAIENRAPYLQKLRLLYGPVKVTEFSTLSFRTFIAFLIDPNGSEFAHLRDQIKRREWEPLAVSSVNRGISYVRMLFRWGVSRELVPAEIVTKLDMVESEHSHFTKAKPRKVVEAVSDDIIEKTLQELSPIVADMVRLQRLTGMRPGELCILRPCDLESIEGVEDVLLYRPRKHKTQHHGKDRLIVIAGKAIAILRPYLSRDEQAYCFSPQEAYDAVLERRRKSRRTPLSCGNKPKANRKIHGNECFTNDSYRRAVARACQRAFKDGTTWAPNQLRHAVAEQVQSLAGLEAAAAVLGHSKIDTTKGYAKHNLTLAIKAMKEVTEAAQ